KWLANRLLFNRFIRCAHGIQYLSDREWQESVPKEKAFLGTNGIDKIHPKDQFRDRVSSIVYIGRLDPYIKGIDILLHALKKQKAPFEDHHCHVSLYGPDEGESHKKIKQMIDELDLEEIVTVYPPVLGDRKHQILTEADCFIQTSRSEGMSMGILEALSYGLPCVITAGTSMKADIDLYDAGWTCKTDPADLSVLLEKVLLSSESDLRKKSSGAIRLIQDRFLTEKVTKTTLDKYRSIISTDGGMDECF
ncbi:MAG: glycosyltransferase, partial [Clostridia bacterium]|nr:glycosyltransferase [Clostridia bacterium]